MKLLTFAELREQPPFEYLIAGMIPEGALVMLYGASGVGKSFVALDLAHSVSAGLPWLGHATRPGAGVYIVAEGWRGFVKRPPAWCAAKSLEDPGPMRYVAEPVRFHDAAHVAELVASLREAGVTPAIIVVDTLAAIMAGGDENTASDMGVLIAGVKVLQQAFGCAAVIVHHSGWDTSRERGSTAIRAACDVVMALRQVGSTLELKVEKMRDAAPPAPILLRLRALRDVDGAVPERLAVEYEAVTPKLRAVLEALRGQPPLSDSDWKDRAGLPKTTFYREKGDAIKRALVAAEGRAFKLTDAGSKVLTDESHGTIWDSHGTGGDSGPISPNPFRDGTVGPSRDRANGARDSDYIPDDVGIAIYAAKCQPRGDAA